MHQVSGGCTSPQLETANPGHDISVAACTLWQSPAPAFLWVALTLLALGTGQMAMAQPASSSGSTTNGVGADAAIDATENNSTPVPDGDSTHRFGTGTAQLTLSPTHTGVRVGPLEARFPHPGVTVSVQTPRVAQRHLWVITKRDDSGEHTVIVAPSAEGTPVLLWEGRTDLHGDLTERTSEVVQIRPKSDGSSSVIVGSQSEAVSMCGHFPVLFPRAVHPETFALTPVSLRPLPLGEPAELQTIVYPSWPPPMLPVLSVRGASSRLGNPEDPALVSPPVELMDTSTETAWLEGRGGIGRWEFVEARVQSSSAPLSAMRIVLDGGGQQNAIVSSLIVVGTQGVVGRARLPFAPDGTAVLVRFPEPLNAGCVALLIEDAVVQEGVEPAAIRTGFAEITGYSPLDFGGGMELLYGLLNSESARGEQAQETLERIGERAGPGIRTRWDQLGSRARPRALAVLVAAGDAEFLTELAGRANEEDARAGVMGLAELRDVPALSTIASGRDDALGAIALAALGESGSQAAPAVLQLAIANPEREGLQGALVATLVDAEASVLEGLVEVPDRSKLAICTVGSRVEAHQDQCANWLVALLPTTPDGPAFPAGFDGFDDRYRWVRAAAPLAAKEGIGSRLLWVGQTAEEWMLRAKAADALQSAMPPGAQRLSYLTGLLEDAYPRVRAFAAARMEGEAGASAVLSRLLAAESWPMVRRAALASLPDDAAGNQAVVERLGDSASSVRALAIEILGERAEVEAAPLIYAKLASDSERARVHEAAIGYALATCDAGADSALATATERGFHPAATEQTISNAALALTVLARIGSPSAADLLSRARNEQAPQLLEGTAERLAADTPRCTRP